MPNLVADRAEEFSRFIQPHTHCMESESIDLHRGFRGESKHHDEGDADADGDLLNSTTFDPSNDRC